MYMLIIKAIVIRIVHPKKIDQIAGELFTSMFVLESEFTFKPVIDKEYYLYLLELCMLIDTVK